jgi:hypothetical protein
MYTAILPESPSKKYSEGNENRNVATDNFLSRRTG